MPARKSQVKKSYPRKKPRLSRRKYQKKSQKKSRKNKKPSRKASGRFNQIKSRIQSRLNQVLGRTREEEVSQYQENMVVSLKNNEDFPECLALKKENKPVKCVGDTKSKRRRHYRDQSMVLHPDKNKGCPDEATAQFQQLAKCCNPNDDYKIVEGYEKQC